MSDKPRRVCLGAFAGAHGVRGEAKLRAFTAIPEDIASYGPLETEDGACVFTVKLVREAKPGVLIVRSADIKSREDALALSGTRLYVDRDRLPEPDEDEFYYDDLVGLRVEGLDGEPLGRVKAVVDFGAGDLLEIIDIPDVNGARLLPFTKEIAPVVDVPGGRIVLAPPADWI